MVLLFATFNMKRYGGILNEYANGMKQVTNMWRTGNILEDTCLVVSCCFEKTMILFKLCIAFPLYILLIQH